MASQYILRKMLVITLMCTQVSRNEFISGSRVDPQAAENLPYHTNFWPLPKIRR